VDENQRVILDALEAAWDRIDGEDWQGTCECPRWRQDECACREQHQELLSRLENALQLVRGWHNPGA
jgi:hypothetical protein